jgi:hypothetical protein
MIVLFAVLCIAAFCPFAPQYLHAKYQGIDFEAFYCGGYVLAHGGNPYLDEPLHACETRVHWVTDRNDLVVPVPLLPVAIAAYVPLGLLPYGIAHALWVALLCAALVAAALVLARLAMIPVSATAPPLLLVSVLSLTLGQVVPVVLLGMMLAAAALRSRATAPLVAGLVLLLAQPAVFLPVAGACVLFGTIRVRIATLAVVLAAAVGCIAIAGVNGNVLYVTKILPMQAMAELPNDTQLSLAALLAQHGASAYIALLAGGLSYLLAVLAGLAAAALASRRWNDPAMLAIAPPAFAVFLGTYVHLQLYALAVPLALVVAARTQWRAAATAMLLLCIPWHWASMSLFLIPALGVATIWFSRAWIAASLPLCAINGLSAGAAMFALALWYIHFAPPRAPAFTYHADPHALAEYAWIAVERTYGMVAESPALDVLRLISISALGWVLALTALAIRLPEVRRA